MVKALEGENPQPDFGVTFVLLVVALGLDVQQKCNDINFQLYFN